MKLIFVILLLTFVTASYSQAPHTIVVEYWQDGTVIDTASNVYQQCRCLMAFTQTVQVDYNAYLEADSTITSIHQWTTSSPWIFKEAQCRGRSGKYNIILSPWDVSLIFLR